MAETTFDLFPLLPGELRDMIWDRAVRPVGFRGVQYFSIHGAKWDSVKYVHHLMSQPEHITTPTVLGAPPPIDSALPPSWNHNQSTYAIDAAFWTACKESYETMRRRYKFGDWAAFYNSTPRRTQAILRPSCSDIRIEKYVDLPALYTVEDNGKRQYVSVMPNQDLIILRDWYDFYLPELEDPLLFESMRYGHVSLGHVAVEFDPSWRCDELEQCLEGWKFDESWGLVSDDNQPRHNQYWQLVRTMGSIDRSTLWMVDRRPRLKATVLNEQDAKKVWNSQWKSLVVFQDNRHKYYQVPLWVADEFCYYGEEAKDPDFETIGDFAQRLDYVCMRQREDLDEEEESPRSFVYEEWNILIYEEDC